MRGNRAGGGLEFTNEFEVGDAIGQLAVEFLVDEAGGAAGDVDELANQIGIHPRHEIVEVKIDVFHRAVQLGGVVITQPLRVQTLRQITVGSDKGAARLRHLLPVHRQKAVRVNCRRQPVAGIFQHRRPEQGVEIQDVLADEMHQFGLGVGPPPGVEIEALVFGIPGKARHVAHRRIQPHIEILARRVGDFETEIGRVAADVPVVQT